MEGESRVIAQRKKSAASKFNSGHRSHLGIKERNGENKEKNFR